MYTNVLLTDNDRHRKFTGVSRFHAAGYYGARVIAASGEGWDTRYNPDGLALDPLGIGDSLGLSSHAVHTAATFWQVAPQARLCMLYSTTGRYGEDGYDNQFLSQSAKMIEEYGISNMFVSKVGTRHKQYFEDLADWLGAHDGFKFFWAAGNDDDDAYNPLLEVKGVTGVAAYTLIVDGTVAPAWYSSESAYVDFAAPSMIRTNIDAAAPSDSGTPHSGTSFSTPWLCGMACLVDDFFLDKTGRPLPREAMMRFFRDHTVDIGAEGFDTKTGYGAVVLPDPAEIDIWAYQVKEDIEMYKDDDKIPGWAREDVYYCKEHGLMEGDAEGTFRPDDPVTRAELACTLARLHRDTQNG